VANYEIFQGGEFREILFASTSLLVFASARRFTVVVATLKASLVAAFFMHLLNDKLFNTTLGSEVDAVAGPFAPHVEIVAHELTHIRLESLARNVSRNRWFATTAASREVAIRSLSPDIKKLERKGYSDDAITRVVLDLVGGLCASVFNTPLDMWIEVLLHREMPSLRHAQFISLHRLATEVLAATTHAEVRKLTPPKVLRASTALAIAYGTAAGSRTCSTTPPTSGTVTSSRGA
jgi:hypothetical protein